MEDAENTRQEMKSRSKVLPQEVNKILKGKS